MGRKVDQGLGQVMLVEVRRPVYNELALITETLPIKNLPLTQLTKVRRRFDVQTDLAIF